MVPSHLTPPSCGQRITIPQRTSIFSTWSMQRGTCRKEEDDIPLAPVPHPMVSPWGGHRGKGLKLRSIRNFWLYITRLRPDTDGKGGQEAQEER